MGTPGAEHGAVGRGTNLIAAALAAKDAALILRQVERLEGLEVDEGGAPSELPLIASGDEQGTVGSRAHRQVADQAAAVGKRGGELAFVGQQVPPLNDPVVGEEHDELVEAGGDADL